MALSDKEFALLIEKATGTNARRDVEDRSAGFAAPADSSRDALLRTAVSAIECAIRVQDWDCAAEGLVMLADACDYHPWHRRHPEREHHT